MQFPVHVCTTLIDIRKSAPWGQLVQINVRNVYFALNLVDLGKVYTDQQEGYPGTVVTEMATDLFSSKHSQCQSSEAESVENRF